MPVAGSDESRPDDLCRDAFFLDWENSHGYPRPWDDQPSYVGILPAITLSCPSRSLVPGPRVRLCIHPLPPATLVSSIPISPSPCDHAPP
ncbi:hypothetical protein EVAR_104005_1 [Eumeta japonica]|uniref:Uncharacterized protein n=1 Tax=Eumeta variegata TaxID=151549 RepID=A0A4C1Y0W2_EUMVA|nr:hypothetical protein EVAR_104005_1 [Eumeta japonica]